MGLFDFFKNIFSPAVESKELAPQPISQRTITKKRLDLVPTLVDELSQRYIAFDVETTGLSPTKDKIIEIGAVLFCKGVPEKSFSSLVNPGIPISPAASAVNHITDEMLASAPAEEDVYRAFTSFLGDALRGQTIMCAHNATFDFSFLSVTLEHLGYSGDFRYVDTLSAAKKYLPGLNSYKQSSLESHFNLYNESSHRALSDAKNCGFILMELLPHVKTSQNRVYQISESSIPTQDELFVCAYIQSLIAERGGDITYLRYYRNSGKYVDVSCLYSIFKFKFSKNGYYIILDNQFVKSFDDSNYIITPCTQTEGGEKFVRVYFSSPFDLAPLADHIYRAYERTYHSMQEYLSTANSPDLSQYLKSQYHLEHEDVISLISQAENHSFSPIQSKKEKAPVQRQTASRKLSQSSPPPTISKQPHKRIILQLDDSGNIIKEFDSISSASKEFDVSPKCIRDAANGKQKHAAGFCWSYKDSDE